MTYDMHIPPTNPQGREFSLVPLTFSETLVPCLKSGAHVAAKMIKDVVKYKEAHEINKGPVVTFSITGMALGAPTLLIHPPSGILVMFGMIGTGLALSCAAAAADRAAWGLAVKMEELSGPINEATNPAKLRSDIFEAAKKAGIIPDQFKDPVTLELIEDPVAFTDDPSATIFDRKTVNNLLERNITTNPVVRSHILQMSKLVSLPEVKKQIDELKSNLPPAIEL